MNVKMKRTSYVEGYIDTQYQDQITEQQYLNTTWRRTVNVKFDDDEFNKLFDQLRTGSLTKDEFITILLDRSPKLDINHSRQIKLYDPSITTTFEKRKQGYLSSKKRAQINCYKSNVKHGQYVCQFISEMVFDRFLSLNIPIYLYGSTLVSTEQKSVKSVIDDYQVKFKEPIKTYDVDVKILEHDYEMVKNEIFGYMVGIGQNNMFMSDGFEVYLYNVTLAEELGANSFSINISVRCSNNHLLYRVPILDCSVIQERDIIMSKVSDINPNVSYQREESYLIGMVDKYYNINLNPRISGGTMAQRFRRIMGKRFADLDVDYKYDDVEPYIQYFDTVRSTPEAQQFLKQLLS